MIVDRRLPLLDATRIIKARRRIVLANKAFQRQLVAFARSRGLLGDLPHDDVTSDADDDDDDDDGGGGGGRLSSRARRLGLNDRGASDWTLNGLRVDLSGNAHRLDPLLSYKSRWRAATAGDWPVPRSSAYLSSAARSNHISAGDARPASRYNDYVTNFSSVPYAAARSRETDDVTPPLYASPRQYRATKSATNLLPPGASGSAAARHTRAPVRPSLHSRSSSASRFSLGFL